jgi:putative phosphoribosyl transferase
MVFKSRKDGAEKLAELLNNYKCKDPVVLACSLTAVEVAHHLSEHLNATLSLVVTNKLTYPGQENYSFGALTEGDQIYIDTARHLLTDRLIQNIVQKSKTLIRHQVINYRKGSPLPDMKGKAVILVEDILLTGLELIPVIRLCKSLNASKIIIGVPAAGTEFARRLNEAHELRIAYQLAGLENAREVYEDHKPLLTSEIKDILNAACV